MNNNKKAKKRLSLLYLDTNCIEHCWFIPNPHPPQQPQRMRRMPHTFQLIFGNHASPGKVATRAAKVQNDKTHFEPQMDADSHRYSETRIPKDGTSAVSSHLKAGFHKKITKLIGGFQTPLLTPRSLC
ncbi:MAG: hypothetical protein PHD76_13890 [Methylacidiphilales bacterium]|nr:hypothetical protein [Candidatus Methylacidiphilales bacterium]